MNKKWTPAVAAVLAASVMFSGEGLAAPKEGTPYNVEMNKKENQSQSRQFKSIDKQLSKIEEKLLHYKEKLNKIEEDEKEGDVDQTDGVEEVEETDEEGSDEVSEDVSDEKGLTGAAASDIVEDAEEGTESNEDSADEEETDEEEEVEKELDDEPGYRGKFQALQNRLNAVSNQLTSLTSKGADPAAVEERQARIVLLKQEIADVLATIGQIEKAVQEEIELDDEAKVEASKEDVSLTKEWTIKFSKKLNAGTLSTLDVVVVDSAGSLVETDFVYSNVTKSIILTPLQPYEPGEVYTLYIGKGIAGTDGVNLKKSVKMSFTIATGTTAAAASIVKAAGFSDVPDRYTDAVQKLVDRGVTSGVGGNKFGLDQQIKRVDAAVMMAKMLNLDLTAPDAGFKDVPQRAKAAVNALVKAGIVSGKTEVTFGSDQTLTRGELAIILTRALQLSGNSAALSFKDVPARYESAVKALVASGIANGKSATAFGTADPIKRGDFAIFLHRAETQESEELEVVGIY
ncbi:S-layer homology domain-containing protein [Domibacillus sp. A3M-37]|uniref:S-layer homology domain-containing protein n=1 Tax=Domibacillus sp. A3M-37 TaxID=2962037 RepID=UPI0020B87C77|nr:S-layer homology domain-containing protein [Domibacillus sp. A3M-37]MCP3761420.1 S-layer homology domain-containing protein [Domibacillus sp. A3M-37]